MGLKPRPGFWQRLGHWLLACLEARVNRYRATPKPPAAPRSGRRHPH